ncbi:hypothetical protein ACLQ9F_11860 [Bordetella avium]|uniref:Phage protein n=1 Tax=Bordetella avium (strain 197N) TaxID=360910 RepID=Q2L283_BORA1|nr:hypothetical protein [Bordetella avium]AZY52246.1 hypothetical protein C0J07_06800 [Bordetella avium]RIQ50188.1 hypothetical protein D0843_12640 [Bordetella avium]RIQ71054.1 hypothetical protein D0838_10045 [Bordetella avium]CAJ49093.1 Putative phage protein [Bordetella avium 197N]
MSHSIPSKTGHIIKCQFPIALAFGHNLLVQTDGNRGLLSEVDGLATSKSGTIKPIGYLPSDQLKVYEFSRPYLYRSIQRQVIIFSGESIEVERRWLALRDGLHAINTLNLPYPILGLGRNSNSVASTLIRCMALDELPIPHSRFAPGQGLMLLPISTINDIQRKHSLVPPPKHS